MAATDFLGMPPGFEVRGLLYGFYGLYYARFYHSKFEAESWHLVYPKP